MESKHQKNSETKKNHLLPTINSNSRIEDQSHQALDRSSKKDFYSNKNSRQA